MTEHEPDAKVMAFVERLQALEAGEKARFKRNADRTLRESRDVLGVFYRLLPFETPTYQMENYFLVATLFPLCDGGGSGNFGNSLRKARDPKNNKGLERRVEILLDAESGQLAFRMRQAVHFLHSKRVKVDWVSLLEDLNGWSHPDRYVQQRWARSFFSQ